MRQRILVYGGRLLILAVIMVGSFAVAAALGPSSGGNVTVLAGLACYLLLSLLLRRLLLRRVLVSVTRACSVDAPPERVWALLSSAEAWSLRPGYHAFDVPPPAGMPPLRLITRARSGRVSCSVVELAELPAAGRRDRSLVIASAGHPEPDAITLTIQVVREGTGTRVGITARQPARLASRLNVQAAWRKMLTAWLGECAAVLTGRRGWPGQAVAPDLLAALAAPLPGEKALEAGASVLIAVDPARAWQAVWDPATSLALPDSSTIAAGFVPGTPVGQPGEIQYSVSRSQRPGGPMLASLQYVRDLEPGRMALTRFSGPIEGEALHRVEPEAGGTRFTLSFRFTDPKVRKAGNGLQAGTEKEVARYKTLLEETGAAHQG